ncbi:MAG TPA: RNA polymerase sigma factor [Candidatus Paceibacterota bacterium]
MNLLNESEDLGQLSDEEILSLSTENPNHFELLVDRYQQKFIDRAFYILRNKEEAADIVQDTFVKIYLNAKRFRPVPGASFKSWAYRILLNTCFTKCKKAKREREVFLRIEEETAEFIPDKAELVTAKQRLDTDQVLSMLSRLPVTLSRVMRLHYVEGKSQEDIATLEGVKNGVIRTRIHRAKKILKNLTTHH